MKRSPLRRRGKKKKRKKNPMIGATDRRRRSKKTMIKRLDSLSSRRTLKIGRECGDGLCWYCRREPADQAGHILSRAFYATRWDSSNILPSCGGCNVRYEHDTRFQADIHKRYRSQFGERTWDELIARSKKSDPWTIEDMEALEAQLEAELA